MEEGNKWLPLGIGAAVVAALYFFWPKSAKAGSKSNDPSQINLTDVTGIQRALTILGYNPGKVDGKYGPNTKSAVSAFQKAHGLGVDAVIGHDTRAAIAKDLKAKGISVLGESGPTIRGVRGVGIISY
jgi:peptidoglycan hydrolase-like protein with peptidoglycan-binding domain